MGSWRISRARRFWTAELLAIGALWIGFAIPAHAAAGQTAPSTRPAAGTPPGFKLAQAPHDSVGAGAADPLPDALPDMDRAPNEPLDEEAPGATSTPTDPWDSDGTPTVGSMAAPYRALMRDMTALSALGFRSPGDIRVATRLILSHDPQAVARGWFAHHAILVANDPRFHSAVTRQARKMGLRRFLAWIKEDRTRLRDAPGFDEAVQAVLDAVNTDTRHMAAMGTLLLARALDLQSARLGDTGLFSWITATNGAALAGAHDLSGRFTPRTINGKARETLDRVVEIAALLALGEAEGPGLARVRQIASERRMDYCVTQARLNFSECVTATRHDEERAFCVGRHGIEELGACWRSLLSTPQ